MPSRVDADRWARPPTGNTDAEPLYQHASTVAAHVSTNTPADATLADGTSIKSLLKTLAWTHDIGKATTWFQQKLGNTAVPDVPAPAGDATSHSPLSAPITWWVCTQSGYSTYASILGALTVARHHGTIPDIRDYLIEDLLGNDQRWRLLDAQAENIAQFASSTADTLLSEGHRASPHVEPDGTASLEWGEFTETLAHGTVREEFWSATQRDYGSGLADVLTDAPVYSDLLQLWGGLKGGDTLAAAGEPPFKRSQPATSQQVAAYIGGLPSASSEIGRELNRARNDARTDVLQAAAQSGGEPGVYSVTLPTGAGKTLTGTQAALALRADAGASGPLIYALPYTSIIDQTAATFTDVFNTTYPSDVLNVHHHLAPIESDTSLPSQSQLSRLARDSWHADVTLTTFVQLWESLTGPGQAQATKLPALYESTIIIDEPQALPLDWWPVVEHLLGTLVRDYSARIILMSATQPQFDTVRETIELAADVEIEIPDRTRFNLDPSLGTDSSPVSSADAAETIHDAVNAGAASVLSIQNTVASTQDVADELTARLDHGSHVSVHDLYTRLLNADATSIDDALPTSSALADAILELGGEAVVTCPLSTRHRPCDRRIIIDALGDILERVNETPSTTPTIVAITTQLVEAGVDISFERVFRDFAPYDSLIQAAGRCNRNYEAGITGGRVTVWRLDAPSNSSSSRLPSDLVYGATGNAVVNRLSLTQTVIQHLADRLSEETVEVSESTVTAHHADYQQLLLERRPADSSISNAIQECLGGELIPASLIDSRPSCSVVVSRSKASDRLIREYQSHLTNYEFEDANRVLAQLRELQVDIPPSNRGERSITDITHTLERGLEGLHCYQVQETDAYSVTHGAQHPTDTVESRFF